MKTALILGINGNFGAQMAHALLDNGWQLKALVRDRNKAPSYLEEHQILEGDANEEQLLRPAIADVDLVVYALNPPYHQWHKFALAMLEKVLMLVEEKRLHLLFPGNVYGFAPQKDTINESVLSSPLTDKGAIRAKMEARLAKAAENGAKITIVRAGDFIGPGTHTSWLDHMLKPNKHRVTLAFPHDENHAHYWTYLPDLCANTVALLEQQSKSFEVWHDPGLVLRQQDWITALSGLGIPVKKGSFPWWMLSLIAPFNPVMREIIKMRYLWQHPVVLDGSKWQLTLGHHFSQTSLDQILLDVLGETLQPEYRAIH